MASTSSHLSNAGAMENNIAGEEDMEVHSVASSDDGWEEMEGDDSQSEVECLFCNQIFPNVESALPHCKDKHSFNLVELASKLSLDDYSYIKLINFIRKHKVNPAVTNLKDRSVWSSDDYLKMEVPNDPWVCFDIDSFDASVPDLVERISKIADLETVPSNEIPRKSDAEYILELEQAVSKLKHELREKQSYLEEAKETVEKVKSMAKNFCSLITDEENGVEISPVPCVKAIPVSMDSSYFDSYADFSIHREMLLDYARTNGYKSAIMLNKETISDKTVLDLGCGTGILSMFAADAGAKKVIGIDQSDIIYNAMDVIRDNGFQSNGKIELVKGRIEDTSLPVEKVDIIVSEWMGYFLLFEAMLDSVVYARDHHLAKPGGIIMPNRFTLELLGASDMECFKETFGLWTDCYGYKMSCLKEEFRKQPLVRIVKRENVITSAANILNLDVYTCDTNSVNFSSVFQLDVLRSGPLTCLVGYFDVFFDLPTLVSFSTGPNVCPTHWKQTVFLLPEPVNVTQGQRIEGELFCRRHPKEIRSLIVDINVFDLKLNFIIS